MSWTKIAEVLHDCELPCRREIKRMPRRSEWTCAECKQKWITGGRLAGWYGIERLQPYNYIPSSVAALKETE